MRFSTICLLSFSSLIYASTPTIQPTNIPTSETTSPPSQTPTYAVEPHHSDAQPLSHHKLELRDGIAVQAGTAQALPDPTQMPSITTYPVRGPNGVPTPMPYTQLFVKVPEQWPEPTAGTIGLGTIQGTIGVVKTQSKRGLSETLPTGVAEKLGLVKRKTGKAGNGNASSNAACAHEVSVLGMAAVVVVGLGMVGTL